LERSVSAGATVLALALLSQTPRVQPELVGPGVISTAGDEFGGASTEDGTTLFFNRSVPRSQAYTLFVSHLVKGVWQEPEVASFSGRWRDFDAVLSPDGRRLFFISDRPDPAVPSREYGAWVVERAGSGWSAPRPLPRPVNGTGGVHFVSATREGTLYFTADRTGNLGPVDVYRARLVDGRYLAAENLGPPVNGAGLLNLEAFVSPDESFLLLGAVGRPDAPGAGDLYVSVRKDGRWLPPRGLGHEVNTRAREYSPRVSNDGQWLLFASERGFPIEPRLRALTYPELRARLRAVDNGLGNIYRVPLRPILSEATSPPE
jgi:hypothetical protein